MVNGKARARICPSKHNVTRCFTRDDILLLAILDDQAVIIHGHSVKNLNESFVMRTEETKRDLVSPESAMFCEHLSHFGMLYNCCQVVFPTGHVMKKCPKYCSLSLF